MKSRRRRLSGWRRQAGPAAVILAVVCSGLVPTAAVASPFSSACLPHRPQGFQSRGSAGPNVEIFSRRRDAEHAENYRVLLATSGAYERFHSNLGLHPFRRGNAAGLPPEPFRLFIVSASELPPGALGVTGIYCDGNGSAGMVSTAVLSDPAEAQITAAHELFHAFQFGAQIGAFPTPGGSGNPSRIPMTSRESWVIESTAEWAAAYTNPDSAAGRDPTFLQRPSVPLTGYFTSGPDNNRQYGAWRFWQYLERRLGPSVWQLVRQTFEREGFSGIRSHSALVIELQRRGHSLGRLLADFWGYHLRARDDPPAPAAMVFGESVTVPVGSSRTHTLTAQGLAARVVRVQAPTGAQGITIRIHPAPSGGFIRGDINGGTGADVIKDYTTGQTLQFVGPGCFGDNTWPGELPLAFTNGRRATQISFRITLTATGRDPRCRNIPPRACPRPPATLRWIATLAPGPHGRMAQSSPDCRPPRPPATPRGSQGPCLPRGCRLRYQRTYTVSDAFGNSATTSYTVEGRHCVTTNLSGVPAYVRPIVALFGRWDFVIHSETQGPYGRFTENTTFTANVTRQSFAQGQKLENVKATLSGTDVHPGTSATIEQEMRERGSFLVRTSGWWLRRPPGALLYGWGRLIPGC